MNQAANLHQAATERQMPVAFADILKTTGSAGQRKGLEPYAGRVVRLTDFKLEYKGNKTDKDGNPKEQRRVLTAQVNTDGLKPRRARVPVKYAARFIEDMDLRADDAEPYEVTAVYVRKGDHGATLHDPNDVPRSEGGWKDEASANGTARRGGRPRKQVAEGAAA